MYDAIAEAIPLAQRGQNRKKALLVISDGNDTASSTGTLRDVKQQIRESEVLVYAIGIDGESVVDGAAHAAAARADAGAVSVSRRPTPAGIELAPAAAERRRRMAGRSAANDDRVNVVALRDMTDDSGGRTEIIRDARDLNPATAGIADELSKQYYLGYRALGKKDGRWHSIRVEVRNRAYRVRARRGYIAS